MSILLTGEKINGATVIIAEPLPHNMPSTGYCTWYNCTRKSEHDGFCFQHKQYSNVPVAAKVKVGIAKVSEKRKVIDKLYRKIKNEILGEDNSCQIKSPACTGIADSLNHTQKRSPNNLTVLTNLKACCCISCNGYIETHDAWARHNGHTISRFAKSVK